MTFKLADCLRAMQGQEMRRTAYLAIARALREGQIVRPSRCQACDATDRIEGHHPDYRDPLCVLWLCRDCHRRLHLLTGRISTKQFGRQHYLWEYPVRKGGRIVGFRNLDLDLRDQPMRQVGSPAA